MGYSMMEHKKHSARYLRWEEEEKEGVEDKSGEHETHTVVLAGNATRAAASVAATSAVAAVAAVYIHFPPSDNKGERGANTGFLLLLFLLTPLPPMIIEKFRSPLFLCEKN